MDTKITDNIATLVTNQYLITLDLIHFYSI